MSTPSPSLLPTIVGGYQRLADNEREDDGAQHSTQTEADYHDVTLNVNDEGVPPTTSTPIPPSSSPPPSSPIRISFRTLTGQLLPITVPTLTGLTILNLKERVDDVHHIPPTFQRYVFGGRELLDDHSVSEYGVEHDSVIHLLLRQNPTAASARPAGDANVAPPADAFGLPVPLDQNGNPINLAANPPVGGIDESLVLTAWRLSRVVKTFTVFDVVLVLILSLSLPFLLVGFPLALAGYYGCTTMKRPYMAMYLLYCVLFIGVRIFVIIYYGTLLIGVVFALGIPIEIYIGSLVWKLMKITKELSPQERMEVVMRNRFQQQFFF